MTYDNWKTMSPEDEADKKTVEEDRSDDTRDWEDRKQIQEQLCDTAAVLLGWDVVRWGRVGDCFIGYNLNPKTEPVSVAWDIAELDMIVNRKKKQQKQSGTVTPKQDNDLLNKIASCLVGIDWGDLTTAESQIVDLLLKTGYLHEGSRAAEVGSNDDTQTSS